MKIIPTSNILIEGKHAAAGVAVETSDAIGNALIVQKLATKAPVAPAKPATAPAPVKPVETADKPAPAAAETAAAK